MTEKDIPFVRPDDAALMIADFSSGFRDRFAFFHPIPKQDIRALNRYLYREAITGFLERHSVTGRARNLLLDMSPEVALRSLATDARRVKDQSAIREIQDIGQTFSPHSLERMTSSRGMDRSDIVPLHFWIQLGKRGVPCLRIWAGFRVGTSSSIGLPREFLRKTVAAGRNGRHLSEHSRYVRASLRGKVYALAVESELRFFVPLSEAQRNRYTYALNRSSLVNGESVRYALAPMLHEIVCPLGIELPLDPYHAGGLVRDASPLDLPVR